MTSFAKTQPAYNFFTFFNLSTPPRSQRLKPDLRKAMIRHAPLNPGAKPYGIA